MYRQFFRSLEISILIQKALSDRNHVPSSEKLSQECRPAPVMYYAIPHTGPKCVLILAWFRASVHSEIAIRHSSDLREDSVSVHR